MAFVAPVVNYWWPSLPKNLIKENYMGGLIRWGLRISKLAPGLLHWLVIFTQKVLASTSSVLESKQVYFSSHDMEVLKRTTGFPMFTKVTSLVFYTKLSIFRNNSILTYITLPCRKSYVKEMFSTL